MRLQIRATKGYLSWYDGAPLDAQQHARRIDRDAYALGQEARRLIVLECNAVRPDYPRVR